MTNHLVSVIVPAYNAENSLEATLNSVMKQPHKLWEALVINDGSTDGTQTDMSHFRRENESQVYLPRDQETQTKQDNGTNPKRMHTYIAGLRNGNSTQYASKYAEDGDNPKQKTKKKTTVVNLTFEL